MTGAMTALWSSPEHRDEHRSERCASCAGERLFEQPACLDGHEPGECPEWACVECGHTIFLGLAECARPVRLLVTAAV
ncbi:hypothetical protein GCM10012278_78250 [Nonomuraea glycinis]|uniref:Uncharacterized protein n=2 Tax=Nonomuraea glycinis TaxID=2047744 RepID=A0A918ADW2_9ACTN|nr:hypothetical protein GCM10012278_78250 [Nonomuraea glycinis]